LRSKRGAGGARVSLLVPVVVPKRARRRLGKTRSDPTTNNQQPCPHSTAPTISPNRSFTRSVDLPEELPRGEQIGIGAAFGEVGKSGGERLVCRIPPAGVEPEPAQVHGCAQAKQPTSLHGRELGGVLEKLLGLLEKGLA